MTEAADDPASRRALVVRAVTAHRREGGDPVVFTAKNVPSARLEYEDRILTFDVLSKQREHLTEVLEDFPVFKIKQPETRKAPDGTVYVSAIADPKHLADFVEDCFLRVYGRDADYRLAVSLE